MFLGRFQLGLYVPLAVRTLGAGFGPGWPDSAPAFAVYDHLRTRIVVGRLPSIDHETGTFGFRLRLGSEFSTGTCTAIIDWTLDGAARREVNRWEIVGGGDANGAVVSMHAYRRPHADFLVEKLDTFQRAIQRNPG